MQAGVQQLLKPISPTSEGIAIISPILRRAIEGIAKCHTDSKDEWEFEDFLTSSRPYPFFFHHHSELKELLNSQDVVTRTQLSSLLDYLSPTERPTEASAIEADNLFTQGLVSKKCLPFLFRPNQLIVTKINGVHIARVIKSWPSKGQLLCWNWMPNGYGVVRWSNTCVIPRMTHDTMAISELVGYDGLDFQSERIHVRF
jgi:hypothetical protein